MWDMWTCGTALWGMNNCTLEMAYIVVERGLPFLPRDCQGRLPVAWVKYDIKTSWAGGLSKNTIGGQNDRRSKNIQKNTSESGIKCVRLNARSIINKKTE